VLVDVTLGIDLFDVRATAVEWPDVATVKHHVHHVLEKLKLRKRAQAMRLVHDAPWISLTSHFRRR